MNNTVMLTIAWVVGQLVYSAVSIFILQRGLPITYWQAVKQYFKREVGRYVISFSGLLLILFIAGDYIVVDINRADLFNKTALSWKEKIILHQRAAAVVLSIFIQHILYVIVKGGKKAIHEYAAKKGVDDNEIN